MSSTQLLHPTETNLNLEQDRNRNIQANFTDFRNNQVPSALFDAMPQQQPIPLSARNTNNNDNNLIESMAPFRFRIRKRKVKEITKSSLKKQPAAVGKLKVDDSKDSDDDPDGKCIICLCEPDAEELATINGCSHKFCFGCIEKWSERENTCPLCKNRFTEIDRVNKPNCDQAEADDARKKTYKKVKKRDQRADLHPSIALEGLLASMGPVRSFQFLGPDLTSDGFQSLQFQVDSSHAVNESDGEDSNLSLFNDDADFSVFTNRVRSHSGISIINPFLPPGMRRVPGTRHIPSLTASLRFHTLPYPHSAAEAAAAAAVAAVPPQSHAVNGHDSSAGITADNALEINDESDDEVEVVGVRRR
eukprot:CAMPEP_0202445916 /NCGR_PEP_ID=MMETSP1360-20130828/4624_1 /ASSEMBLY_ACC=CAM_ASM_000848 /TAXON_ID=515479 /ORGANISM="Licmophora paradoxa, Strain CCMP2313" /LENGTH=360 /DNA_ID=CAMNT_0049062323 /DNA_START=244 /DNA_END=1326 /DNA_ORIENTATION=-